MSSCYHPLSFKKRAGNLTEGNSGINTSKENNLKFKQKPIKKHSISKRIQSEELDDLDSLKLLKDNKKFNDLDNKIKVLKFELMSLVGGTSKSEHKSSIFNEQNKKDVSDNLDLNSSVEESFVGERKKEFSLISKVESKDDFSPQKIPKHFNCDFPIKFAEWLDTTIDTIDSETKDSGANKNKGTYGSNIKNLDLPNKNPTTSSNYLNDGFKPSNLPKLKPEKLLYESFLLKNLDKYLSSSDESTPDQIKPSISRLKNQKSKGKKICQKESVKKRKKRFRQNKVNKYRVGQSFSYSNVEMINSDPDYSILETGQMQNNEVIDLDLENLNWDEPFDVDKKEGSCLSNSDVMESDCEVICISQPGDTLSTRKEKQVNEKSKNNEIKKTKFWECPICFEQSTGQEIVTTLCGHVYCKQCLETYHLTTTKNCPSCRTDLSGKPLVTLFNF